MHKIKLKSKVKINISIFWVIKNSVLQVIQNKKNVLSYLFVLINIQFQVIL